MSKKYRGSRRMFADQSPISWTALAGAGLFCARFTAVKMAGLIGRITRKYMRRSKHSGRQFLSVPASELITLSRYARGIMMSTGELATVGIRRLRPEDQAKGLTVHYPTPLERAIRYTMTGELATVR